MSRSDTHSSDLGRPEWLVNSKLHGDNVVGSLVPLACIAHMVSNHEPDQFVRRMIDRRRFILIPFTNAIDHFMSVRTEVQEGEPGQSPSLIDPNHDFRHNQHADKCIQTVTARTINKLVQVHLFRVLPPSTVV